MGMPTLIARPAPRNAAGTAAATDIGTDTGTGDVAKLAGVLAEVMRTDQVPPDSHFFDELGADSLVMAKFCARLRKREDLPSVSMQDIYANPSIRSLARSLGLEQVAGPGALTTGPVTGGAAKLAGVLAEVMRTDQVPPDSHFFDELGADSLVMAKFCARLRKREDLPSVSMQDIYANPSIRGLARSLGLDGATPEAVALPDFDDVATLIQPRDPILMRQVSSGSTRQYVVCGSLQLLFFLVYAWAAALAAPGRMAGFPAPTAMPTSTCGRSSSAGQPSLRCASLRSRSSGSSSAAGSRSRSASGAWGTSASGSSGR